MTDRLKPCPFCGSESICIVGGGTFPFWIECEGCNTTSKPFNLKEESVNQWNRRTL